MGGINKRSDIAEEKKTKESKDRKTIKNETQLEMENFF